MSTKHAAAAAFLHVSMDLGNPGVELRWEELQQRLWIRGPEPRGKITGHDTLITVVLQGLSLDQLLERIAQA